MTTHRNLLHVDQPAGERFKLALEQLGAGQSVVYRGVVLSIAGGELHVEVPSEWSARNVDESRARAMLASAARVVEGLVTASGAFSALVDGSSRRFTLVEDYGNGAVAICELVWEEFRWMPGFPI